MLEEAALEFRQISLNAYEGIAPLIYCTHPEKGHFWLLATPPTFQAKNLCF